MKKKILIIGPFPPPTSGVSFANEIVAKGLNNKKWSVDSINSEYSENITDKHGSLDFHKFRFIKTYFLVYKVMLSKVIYITIGQSFFGVLKYAPFILFAKLLKKTLVVHLHGNHLLNEYNSLKGLKKFFFAKLVAQFDHGIVLSDSLKSNLTPFIKPQNIHILFNFVEDKLIVSDKELDKRKDFSEIKIFFMSNLLQEKGVNILLHAIKKLNSENNFIKVKIAGTKILGNNIDELLTSLPNVDYVGVVHNKEKQNLLIWGNVFCLPTYFNMEGQPISILEAMALNNLILTTKHAGIPDICSDENAVFCEIKSHEDLYNKIKYIISNWNELKKKAILNGIYAREEFSEIKFITNVEKILLTSMIKN